MTDCPRSSARRIPIAVASIKDRCDSNQTQLLRCVKLIGRLFGSSGNHQFAFALAKVWSQPCCSFKARSFVARHPCLFSLASGRASHFLLRGQEKSNQREGHPDAAVSGHPALRLRNATPGVRRQSIPGLASNWAQSLAPTLRAIPTSRCRCIGAPVTAHRAQQRRCRLPHAAALLWHFLLPCNGRRCPEGG